MDDDNTDAVPLHSVRKSEDRGGFLSSVGLSGSRGNSYKPLGEDVETHSGYADSSYNTKAGESYKPSSSPYKPDGGSYKMDYGSDSREAELRRREEELAARERALNEREETLRTMPPGTRPALNFPPLYPIMYHDIDAEVPIGDRRTVRTIFYCWLALEAMLLFNCISCLIVLVSHGEDVSNAGASFGSSFVYLFTISAASFFLWYRPVYNAYMKDSSMFFYFFFVFNGFHILFDAYMAVGIPGTGSAGIITMIQCLSSSKKAAAAFCGITFSLWVMHAFVSLFMYFKVRHHYHARGHTFSEAKSQAYQGFAQSGAGQAAVSTAAGAYLRSNTGNFV
ncbi:scamp-domain-containing protein [Linderina pennispora]|uniref:Scamp-domain-containing protein n=1 Tax=Linderina pennispora TaxID=61395 RepID=A0A1Y1WCM7_9FUNG|nr:scamp-domain-containing protein [Linderina pennispora]ORX71293.1 scamp-domain-containing protein [Linderina pennispora]